MKLSGYIKEIKSNSFAIPIYCDSNNNFYTHDLDQNFKILGFEKLEESSFKHHFKNIYFSKSFNKGNTGAIVFIGFDNYLIYNYADLAVDEVEYYLTSVSDRGALTNIKDELNRLKAILSSTDIDTSDASESQIILKAVDEYGYQIIDYKLIDTSKTITRYSLKEYLKKESMLIGDSIKSDEVPNNIPDVTNIINWVDKQILYHLLYKQVKLQQMYKFNNELFTSLKSYEILKAYFNYKAYNFYILNSETKQKNKCLFMPSQVSDFNHNFICDISSKNGIEDELLEKIVDKIFEESDYKKD